MSFSINEYSQLLASLGWGGRSGERDPRTNPLEERQLYLAHAFSQTATLY